MTPIIAIDPGPVRSALEKHCTKCGQTKPAEEFYRSNYSSDGLSSWCKPCDRARTRDRSAETASYRETARYQEAQAKYRASTRARESRRAYDEKRKADAAGRRKMDARQAVADAVKYGRLKKAPACEQCGAEPVEAHHEDYSKPLDVQWLCKRCHVRADADLRRRNGSN